jgi:hypothetical protein
VERVAQQVGLGPGTAYHRHKKVIARAEEAPIRDHMAPDASHPTEITLALRVRRWLRWMTGEAGR